jgi:exo-beta-1,3-glucanase (GH17 family)
MMSWFNEGYMKHWLLLVITMALLGYGHSAFARKPVKNIQQETLQCAAFSPYVGNLNPDYGAYPSKELINELLDKLVKQTPFRCIMTYGVLNGLDAIFSAAKARHIKVIAIIWLDDYTDINTLSIAKGIEVAKAFPDTIIKLSCGSEVRTRHGNIFDGEITRCINDLRKAGVTQPITTIDTWWEWCNRSLTCEQTSFATQVDWIGTNIFPWWENLFSGVHTCIPADKAADFHIARLEELHKTYPGKEVIMTEFGWPNGPEGDTETNPNSGQHCGIANTKNQTLVVQSTFKKLAEKKWSGIVFEAFSETWKLSKEGGVGSFWGVCSGVPPYNCTKGLINR